MTSLLTLVLRLPRRRLATAAVASKYLLAQASRNRGLARGRPRRETGGGASRVAVALGLSAFSLFSHEAAEEEEEEGKEEEEKPEASAEDAIVLLLKKAKLSIMKGELDEAERILHEAARLSHQSDNKAAIIYTYNTMANLAFIRGHLEQAEKLFKATMSYLLAGDVTPDNNAILEMSLKLASIYAAQNRDKLALAGYEFCILTLEEKITKEKEMPVDPLAEEEKLNTHLLLAMSLDSFARYLLAHSQAAQAQRMYERALQISVEFQGETHPQTVVVMSDLATALDAQGRYEDAYIQLRRAVELARQTEHPEAHIILNNLAGILVHKEDYSQARQVYQEALERAEKSKDGVSVRYIKAELAGLARRKRMQSKARADLPEENGGKAGAGGE